MIMITRAKARASNRCLVRKDRRCDENENENENEMAGDGILERKSWRSHAPQPPFPTRRASLVSSCMDRGDLFSLTGSHK